MPSNKGGAMEQLSRALETNVTLVTLDMRKNRLHPEIKMSLKRTMEERRDTTPRSIGAMTTFLLCASKWEERHKETPDLEISPFADTEEDAEEEDDPTLTLISLKDGQRFTMSADALRCTSSGPLANLLEGNDHCTTYM
jgi:hypothetical protein